MNLLPLFKRQLIHRCLVEGNEEELQEVEWLYDVRKSVSTYAASRFQVYARKVIYRLQRIEASGIFGDDFNHKTGWDEYCYEVQNGPHTLFEQAWDHHIGTFLLMLYPRFRMTKRFFSLSPLSS